MRLWGISFINGYLQTWGAACAVRRWPLVGQRLYRALQAACGKLTGHRYSRTEWSYSGGLTADVWCRWCNALGQIPYSQLEERFSEARSIVWGATGCDIRQGAWLPPDSPNSINTPADSTI